MMNILAWVFAVRAALAVHRRYVPGGAAEQTAIVDEFAAQMRQTSRYLGSGLLALAVIFPMLPFVDRRLLDIGILVLTYIMLGWGLNIVVGLADRKSKRLNSSH